MTSSPTTLSPEALAALAAALGHKVTTMDLGAEYGVLASCGCGMVARDLVGGVGPTGSALGKRCPHAAR